MRPKRLQALEAARVGIPAGEYGSADHDAKSLEQALRQAAVLGGDHEEVSAFGDGLLRAFGVHAKRADEKRPAPVDVQALAEPAQEHAVAACRGSDPYRFDVAT